MDLTLSLLLKRNIALKGVQLISDYDFLILFFTSLLFLTNISAVPDDFIAHLFLTEDK